MGRAKSRKAVRSAVFLIALIALIALLFMGWN